MHSDRISLLLLLLVGSLAGIQDPIIIPLAAMPYRMAVSEDGSMIVVTYSIAKDADVLIKTDNGFLHSQTLPTSFAALDVAITADNSILLNIDYFTIIFYAKGAGGLYEMDSTISKNGITDVQVCPNGEFVAISWGSN